MNIPGTGADRKERVPETALQGPVSCLFCETDLVIHPDHAEVLRMGTPKKRRVVIPKDKPLKKRGAFKPKKADWEDADPDGWAA